MRYYEGLTFSEFKKDLHKLFQNLVTYIDGLKVNSGHYFDKEIVGSFKVINDKSAKYIGQFTYSPNNRQRNLKINFYQLREIYKETFLKLNVLFEDYCKIILLHELGHAIDFNSNNVQEQPLETFTNELAWTLKNINEGQHDVICEANKAIFQINRYVKQTIYMREKKANEIAQLLIKKMERNNHSLKRAFKIFLAHHKQYLEFEDIPIIRGLIVKGNVSSPVQHVMKEYLGKRIAEKYRGILNRIKQEKSSKKGNVVLFRF